MALGLPLTSCGRTYRQKGYRFVPTPQTGDVAPDFALSTDSGEIFRLSGHRGNVVVLFFYPQDDTQGCTIENLEFSALREEFAAAGATVVGISPDSVESHCRFRDRHKLGVVLAADPERVAIEAYGLWGPKVTFGHEHIGLHRTTFIIGPDGRVAGVHPVPRIKGHAAKMLEAVRLLATSQGRVTEKTVRGGARRGSAARSESR